MQIKTTRYHLTSVRMAIINKSTNKCWLECEMLVGMQIGAAMLESCMGLPQKIKNGTGLGPQ